MRNLMIIWAFLAAQFGVSFGAPREVVIFYTNDIHGHFAPEPASWRKDHALTGGMDALYDHLQSLRALHPNSIYLDAGDLMTGNPVCNIEYNGVKGGALLEMLKRCDIAAECLGNHEFDLGADHLRKYIASAQYPLLCANVREKSTGELLAAPTHVFTVNGVRIGVIGLILNSLSGVASKTAIEPFHVDDVASTAQKQIDELAPSTDLIVLLTHEGVDDDSALAARIHHANVIVGGHSHTRLEHAKRVNGIPIVQAGSYLQDLGMLDLWVNADSVVSCHDSLVALTVSGNPSPSPVSALADSLGAAIQHRYGQKIGELAESWNKSYYTGSNVGNWICDRLRERYKADVALVNAGGIRADVPAGPVTMIQIQELLPFVNTMVIFNASGSDLMKTALEQARAQGLHKHGVLEISGMNIRFKKNGGHVELAGVTIGGKPVSAERSYRVVTLDYVAVSQWNEYLKFAPRDLQTTTDLVSDAVGEEIKNSGGPIHADPTPRIEEAH